MAAYAALTSLMQILDQIEHHPFPPVSLDKQQVDSLTEIVTFLQEFLEKYDSPFVDSDEADPLEMRIADAAYAAEDVIESYIVDVIQLRQSASADILTRISRSFFIWFRGYNKGRATRDLKKVIEKMDSIKKTIEMMREKSSTEVQPHHQQRNILRSSSANVKNSSVMVGFDDMLLQLLDKLTGGPSSRQIIPITGMGRIGKTTLARNIFQHAYVKEYFDICVWVTISQQYNTKEILNQILYEANVKSSEKTEHELGGELHRYLFGSRYLIIMDDIWSIEVWEKMRHFFADCNNGSRIIVTTRQSFLTTQLTESNYSLDMKFLDEVNGWNLFSKTIFGEESFPVPLKEIGKKIVKNCRGLPLSIVVIGGLLAKSEHTQEHWEYIEEKVNSIVNSENDEYCLKMLKMSYNHLPAYLKPSFLYMGIFEEDTRIHVSTLIKLWVSEGFLKPENGKSLETIGEGFLKDLIDRNLLLVDGLGYTGNIKYCKMHDLLRDLCLKEAEKERFYHVIGQHSPQGKDKHNLRRMVYPERTSKESVLDALKSTSHVRSFTSQSQCGSVGLFPNLRLLRIFNTHLRCKGELLLEDVIHELVNSQYVVIDNFSWKTKLPSSVNFVWNLQTLRIDVHDAERRRIIEPIEIWKMSQLRHVKIVRAFMYLPDPPSGSSIVILENLKTLKGIVNLKCGEEVVKRIPNIKKLKIDYIEIRRHDGDDYCLNNLKSLHKLESLTMRVYNSNDNFLHHITFPRSLKKLSLELSSVWVVWEEMLEKIGGLLPLLEKLKLERGRFRYGMWKTVEGQFPRLKYLEVSGCLGLKHWMTDDKSHFPCLEHLHFRELKELEEIPLEMGEILTLQSIKLWYCSELAVKSAKKIVEEQEELQGGEEHLPFLVRVREHRDKQEALQSLASRNFQFTWTY